MKVKIISCLNDPCKIVWYHKQIGSIIDVLYYNEDAYVVSGIKHVYIMKCDCEVIKTKHVNIMKCDCEVIKIEEKKEPKFKVGDIVISKTSSDIGRHRGIIKYIERLENPHPLYYYDVLFYNENKMWMVNENNLELLEPIAKEPVKKNYCKDCFFYSFQPTLVNFCNRYPRSVVKSKLDYCGEFQKKDKD